MNRHWQSISKRAGDHHIGQTLIRLARMAQVMHRQDASTQTTLTQNDSKQIEDDHRVRKGCSHDA